MKKKIVSVSMMVTMLWLLIISLLALPALAAEKKQKSKGPKPVGAVFSSNGGVFPVGKYGTILKYMTFSKDQYYSGSDDVDFVAPKPGKGPKKKPYEKNAQISKLVLRTGIYKDFDVRMIVPYWDKELKMATVRGNTNIDNSGIGDISLISRYRIMSQKKGPFNLAVGLGVKMPTGRSDETSDETNKTLPGFLQNGSGSWDPIIELGMHKIIGRHWLSSHFLYHMTTEGELGAADFERPDTFKYNAAYGFALSRLFDLGIEINGVVKNKAELNGIKKENTGGHTLFLTPGVHFKFAKGMHFDICAPIVVYRDLNGTQLGEDYRVMAKLAFTF